MGKDVLSKRRATRETTLAVSSKTRQIAACAKTAHFQGEGMSTTTTQSVNLYRETFENAIAALLVTLAQLLAPVRKDQAKKRRRDKQPKRTAK
jgi:hypothetical protein